MADPPEGAVPIKPTMGAAMDEYKLLLNVTSRGGKLVRRPSIKAKFMGYGYPGRDASAEEAFQYNASSTTGTGATYTKQTGGGDVNEQHKGRWWTMPQYQPKDHTQDQTDTTPSFQYEDVAEGIDVEIVNGKLICFYATRKRLATASTDATDIRMKVSVHSIADPLIGHLGLAQKESDALKMASTKMGGAQAYLATQYWEKRIQRVGEGFALVGNGVGARVWATGSGFTEFTENLVVFDDAGIKTTQTTSISDPEGLLWFQGFQLPFYRLGDPVTTVERLVEDSVLYAKRRPHNAFLFIDGLGYPIWYGFRRADRQEVSSSLPSANAILDGVPVQLREGTNYILDPGMVWFGEAMNPTSLPALGYFTAQQGSRSNEVVALARTMRGTLAFTRDSIEMLTGHYLALDSKLVHTGIGCDSRWSVKNVGMGVAFVNKDGLHFIGPDPSTGQGSEMSLNRVRAFDDLFKDGVDFERTPYSDLVVGDSATETVANHPNSLGGSGLAASRYSQELNKVYNHTKHDDADDSGGTSMPFGKYKIDKTRLDRAVAGVWEDLYLFACSRDIDDGGDDNRLILVWNYKENTSTVWLMPKHMGWRGFAYDGGMSVPYVMTRYGLAQLNNSKDHDEPFYRVGNDNDNDWRVDIGSYKVFVNQTSSIKPRAPSDRETGDNNTGYDQQALPVLIAGQTRFLSGNNQAFVVPRVMIAHDKHRYGWTRKSAGNLQSLDQDDWSNFKKDDDTDMRIQIWGNQTDLEAGTMNEQYAVSAYSSTETDYDLKSFVMSDIGMLDSLYKGAGEKEFRGIRVHPEDIDGGSKTVDHTHGHLRYGSSSTFNDADQTPVRRLRGAVHRTSTARSHIGATKQQIQFYTLDPGTIYSVLVEIDRLAPAGGRG